MESKEIEVNSKKYTVTELKYKDVAKLGDVSKEEAAKQMMILSTGISEEDYDNLSMREGIELQKTINELNGLSEDFQTPLTP